MKKDNCVYLRHILDAITRVEEYTKGTDYKGFLGNSLIQAGVIREIEIVGEATKKLSQDFTARYPAVPWKKIAGMRDKLIHDYLGVDPEAVWYTVERDMPKLKREVKGILKTEISK